jgi:hypothetical protein
MANMKVTMRDLMGKYQDHCPGCIKLLSAIWEFPARSRYGHGDLCSECGQREAFEGDFIGRQIADHLAHVKQQR